MTKTPSGKLPRRYARAYTFADNYIEANNVGKNLVVSEPAASRRYLFRFNSPCGKRIFKDTNGYDNRANRSFLGRLYWGGTKVSHVVIMFNGLDETIHQFGSEVETFRLYDQLGQHLASHDFMAILLPTPYHLNRVLSCTLRESKKHPETDVWTDMTVPTNALMRHNGNIYRNHFQGFKETIALCRALRPELRSTVFPEFPVEDCITTETRELLSDALETHPRISLIGYSLGGLRAITEYLRDRYEARHLETKREPLFTSCVTINSGGALHNLASPSWVEDRQWAAMLDDLLRQRLEINDDRFRDIVKVDLEAARRHFAFLEDVFLGQAISLNTLAKRDTNISKGMLFIMGGEDQLVPLRALDRLIPSGGLNIFQVAGMGHIFPYDEGWEQWKSVVFEVIAMFLKNMAIRAPSRRGIVEQIALLDHHFKILPYQSNLRSEGVVTAAQEGLRHRIQDLARVVLGDNEMHGLQKTLKLNEPEINERFVEYATSLLRKLRRNVQEERWHPGVYKRSRRELLLGSYLTNDNIDLMEAWEEFRATNAEKRLGEALFENKLVSERLLESALLSQKEDLDRIRRQLSADFFHYLKNRPKVA